MILLYSCGKNEEVYQPVKIQDPYVIYKEAMDAFDKKNILQRKIFTSRIKF